MNLAIHIIAATAVSGGLAALVMGQVAGIAPLLLGLAALVVLGSRR